MPRVIVQEAKEEHYEQIISLIRKLLDTEGDWARNQHLFSYKWPSMPEFTGTTPGYVILADNKVVGYTGYIVSKRYINGQYVEWVSGTTAAVEPEYRTYYLKLLLMRFSQKNTLRIAYAPRENVEKILTCRAFNFKLFDSIAYIFPTFFSILSNRKRRVKLFLDKNLALEKATEYEKTLIDDNCNYIAKAAKITTPEGDFIIIYRNFRLCIKAILKPKVTFTEILYAGDKPLLKKYIREITGQIFTKGKVPFLLCPSRFLEGGAIPWAMHKRFKCFCAGDENINIDLSEIDDLYSEKTIIDFYNNPKSVYFSFNRILKKEDPLAID